MPRAPTRLVCCVVDSSCKFVVQRSNSEYFFLGYPFDMAICKGASGAFPVDIAGVVKS